MVFKRAAVFAIGCCYIFPALGCVQYELAFIESLKVHTLVATSQLEAFQVQLDDLEQQLAVYNAQNDEIPVSVNAFSDLSQEILSNSELTKTLGASVDVDLSFWTLDTKAQLTQAQLQRVRLAIQSVEQARRSEVLTQLLSYIASAELVELFDLRELLLESQLAFLNLEQANGGNRLSEIIETEFKISELINKRLGARAAIERARLNLNVETIQLDTNQRQLAGVGEFMVSNCVKLPLQEAVVKADVGIAKLQKQLTQNEQGVKLKSSVSLVSDIDNNPQSALGLRLEVPLYTGGAYNTRDRELERAVIRAEGDVKRVQGDIARATRERKVLDELTLSSMALIEQRISEGERLISELEERRELGQSTFNEIVSRRIDLSIQHEALVRLRKDFYQSAIEYSTLMGNI